MTMPFTVKQALSSFLRPLALAVPVLACAALSGCDPVDAPQPEDGEAWIVAQLEAVADLTAQEQAQHFAAVAEDLDIARSHQRPSAPTLDLAGSEDLPESALMSSCEWMTGCVWWEAQYGCIAAEQCYVCTNGEWGCVIISGNGY